VVWYLEREPRAVSAVLHRLLRVIEGHLRQGSGSGALSPAHAALMGPGLGWLSRGP